MHTVHPGFSRGRACEFRDCASAKSAGGRTRIGDRGIGAGACQLVRLGRIRGLLGYGYLKSKPARTVARQFLTDVRAGNIAQPRRPRQTLTPAEIQAGSNALKPLGLLTNFTFTAYNYNSILGGPVLTLNGVGTFAKGSKFFTFTLAGSGSSYTVTSFKFQ